MHSSDGTRALRVLVASVDSSGIGFAEKIIPRLVSQPSISLRVIIGENDLRNGLSLPQKALYANVAANCGDECSYTHREHVARNAEIRLKAAQLCEWADLLCLAPVDAQTLAKLLQGMVDNLLLEVVRSWDVSKRILLVPAMSTLMWENPMSKKQLSKLRRKWSWVRVMQPLLWTFDSKGAQKVLSWDVVEDIVETVRNQIDLLAIEHDVASPRPFPIPMVNQPMRTKLPPEIWSLIVDHAGDWELAQALHIYTTLPRPREWQRKQPIDPAQKLMKDLEWAILTGTLADVKHLLATNPSPQWLSHLCVKLTVKFSNIPLLSYLEASHPILFETFRHKRLPTLASATFGKVDVLDWWLQSPSFLTKEYTSECLDGASRAGFTHVLAWWRASGLPLRYTEAALEAASSKGDLEVLDWWKAASEEVPDADAAAEAAALDSEPYLQSLAVPSPSPPPLQLKVGKSVVFAAQHNQVAALRWWEASGVAYAHADQVARIASACGFECVLQLWKELKGEKLMFDNQVLVAATKGGHTNVLEWWRCSGYRVEYKTCDIEEALEDSVSGRREVAVRQWWARNGLNLGISTSEWTKTKILG